MFLAIDFSISLGECPFSYCGNCSGAFIGGNGYCGLSVPIAYFVGKKSI